MKRFVLILILITTGFSAFSQKIKYKDLYVLLRAKNYKDGAVFLQKFLIDNPEHPNANYQMGLMLESNLKELDLLKQSEIVISKGDSAILYFDKAYALINEKEIKKHDDDYYELFKRRNLRTGKFEVILSDVQLDIENRKNILVKKSEDMVTIISSFNNAIQLYDSVLTDYYIVKDYYHDELTLRFGAVDSTSKRIKRIVENYDASLTKFKHYKKLKSQFESSSSETIIEVSPLGGLLNELEKPDFYANKVIFNDFATWGNKELSLIEKHQILLNNLVEFDESLEVMLNQVLQDSVDLSSDVFEKITNTYFKELKLLDSESAIYKLLSYKIGQININSALANWYLNYADTANIGLQVNFVNNLFNELEGLKLIKPALSVVNEEFFWKRYHGFIIPRYTSLEKFNQFLKTQEEVVASQQTIIDKIALLVSERNSWGYFNDDKIPLSLKIDSLTYHTLFVDSLDSDEIKVAGWFTSKTSNYLYFALVPSSRQIDSLFSIETKNLPEDFNSPSFLVKAAKGLIGTTIYLMGTPEKGSYTLIHVSESTGILWDKVIRLNIASEPVLSYANGYIIISQGDVVQNFSLDNGEAINE